MVNRCHHWIFLIFFSVCLCSCASSDTPVRTSHTPPTPILPTDRPTEKPALQTRDFSDQKRQLIVNHALSSLGVPYKWGGQARSTGFDCSGLVVFTHRQAGLALPRRAYEQYISGRDVSKKNLKPADLVFFKLSEESKSYHVGIYIGDGLFVHAPGKNRDVTYARLDNPYFKQIYLGSKTFL